MSIADFCVAGFPKCGTTATIRMLRESPALKVHFANGKPESPFFVKARNLAMPQIEPGKPNGHKFSAYLYSDRALDALMAGNPDALIVINVRPAGEALLSWSDMHRHIAARNTLAHFATRTDEARQFYMNCTAAEHYWAYSKARLNYAQRIRHFQKRWPQANIMIVTQQRLSADARGVMTSVHDRLGVAPVASYLESLPTGHTSKGSRDLAALVSDPAAVAEIRELDRELIALMDALHPSYVLRCETGGF